ncbi:protein asteroid homolog 1-like [Halichondria panicea]|uniref:protein asteroid homolog 1-like n=1 Tax=Halichondria panicea TaxID=6063 RepID=UPI00312B6A3C
MGIRTLTTYMNEKGHFEFVTLKKVSSRIVIDGFSLSYQLFCGIGWGDYCEFYEKVLDFFTMLKSIGIEAYVVVDGIDYENEKAATSDDRVLQRLRMLSRAKSQIEQLKKNKMIVPNLAKVVFVDAVRKTIGARFFVADGEADRDVVSLANHLGCPVLGLDSDFFIFNINHGLILIPHNLQDLKTEVQYFHYQKFDRTCSFSHPQIRLFLPYCLGNDFHGRHALPELGIDQEAKVELIVEKLNNSSLNIDDYQGELASDRKFYEVVPHSFEDLSQHSAFSTSVPQWIVSRFKRGEFSRNVMHFLVGHILKGSKIWNYLLVVEDMKRESAWKVTNSVLLYAIGALISCYESGSIPEIIVRVRQKSLCKLEERNVSSSLNEKHLEILGSHNLLNIPDMPKIKQRDIVLRVFQCKQISAELENVSEDLKLAVVASRCWLMAIHSSVDHRFKAFILALILCLQKCLCKGSDEIKDCRNQMKALDRIHYLAQWECMLHLANTFNQILGCPFTYTSLGRMFSATVFQRFFVNLPDPLYSMLDEEGRIMYNAITKELLPDAPVEPVRQAHAVRLQYSIPTQNRFASLSNFVD